MKIIVAATRHGHALSRREVEAVFDALPEDFSSDIEEFAWPVKEKTPEIRERAIRELLVGVARMRSDSVFWRPLSAGERRDHQDFVELWLPSCLQAVAKGQSPKL